MRHAPVLVERADREARDLVAPEPVVEQDGEECPVAPRLEAPPSGALSSRRAWASESAGVRPSFAFSILGRFTPETGFSWTALALQR